ncbi:CidA/LrgA family protein [Fredinandcohnia humi]
MKYIMIIVQILVLYLFFLVGTLIQNLLNISLPGSIIGMLLLFVLLQTNVIKEKWLATGANFLLTYLALLFVPATVGLMDYLPFFKGKGLITIGIVLVSTILVMLLSSVIGQGLIYRNKQSQDKNREGGIGA